MKKQVCRKFKYGYCKYGDKCYFRHVKDICSDKNCNVFNCERRHPRKCNFFGEYGKCKFTTYCSYKHEKQVNATENAEKIKTIETQLKTIENKHKEPETPSMLENLETKFKAFENVTENKIETLEKAFENRCRELENKFADEIKKKDSYIENLNNQVHTLSESLTEKLNKLESNIKTDKQNLKCEQCKFTTSSEQGLKTHVAKKHKLETKTETNVTYPTTCDLCDKTIKDRREMIKHKRNHSFRYVTFKCVKCDFLGEDKLAMLVHTGKTHGDKFECGLCDYIAKDLETLETHLSTCETYKCNICDKTVTKLTDIKTHFLQKHEANESNQLVKHIKQSRENEDEFDEKGYSFKDLFPEL